MSQVALLIGGNQSDRHRLIDEATELIRNRIGSVVALSKVYETEPWGDFGVESGEQKVKNFLNRALLVETLLSPHEVLHESLAIEAELGRVRPKLSSKRYHSRPMDIDLIFYDQEVIDTPDLTIPHPRMHLRRFVLEPLAEIMPDYSHPLLHMTVEQMLKEL